MTKIKDNDPTTLRHLGNMYYEGKGVEKNHEKAIWCHKVSANLLVKELNYRIGLEYYCNVTYESKPKVEVGLIYINEAINQGYSTATRFMAEKYYHGNNNIDKDQVKALKVHKMLADRKNGPENFSLGKEYYNGHGDLQKNTTIGLNYLNTAALDKNYSTALQYLGDLFFYGDDGIDEDQKKSIEAS
jgi:TPR repeat protein